MGYKPSRYNFFLQADDGTHLAYNAMSGGFARIKDENYEEVQKILKNPNNYKADTEERKELWDSLVRGRFLIEEEVDELKVLKLRNRIARFNTDTLNLTVVPTLRCNFRCVYCYETAKNGTMHKRVQDSLVSIVKEKCKTVKVLHIAWYGGEPLLCMSLIESLTEEFKKSCDENNCTYTSSIVTNGYLLTREVFERLRESSIRRIQVTLDGPPKVHDKRRMLANGKEPSKKFLVI